MKEVKDSLLDTIQLKVCYGHETIMEFVNHTLSKFEITQLASLIEYKSMMVSILKKIKSV